MLIIGIALYVRFITSHQTLLCQPTPAVGRKRYRKQMTFDAALVGAPHFERKSDGAFCCKRSISQPLIDDLLAAT